jgi:hypothetical protein
MSLPLNVDPEHVLRDLQEGNVSWHTYQFRSETTNQLVDPATLLIEIKPPGHLPRASRPQPDGYLAHPDDGHLTGRGARWRRHGRGQLRLTPACRSC